MRTVLPHRSAQLIAVVLSAALLCSTATPALAVTNASIRAKQREADAATKKEQALGDDLEARGEELAAIESKVDDTRRQISDAETQLAIATANLVQSERQLDNRASSIYRNGAVSPVSVLVGASDFSDFITRLDLMRRIGNSDASIVASVKDAKANVESMKSSLETRRSEELALRAAARDKLSEVNDALDAQKRYVASIRTDLKRLIATERKRQAALAAKRAAEQAARDAARRRSWSTGRGRSGSVGELGSSHSAVVRIASHYLGVPYVWGGTSPSGFDCSGLVQYCYRQIGINLPRTSRAQYHVGSFIPANRTDLLAPGDLVFFGTNGDPSRVHHVALYTGGGMMIEAPYTGDVVRRSSLFARISSRHDYVGGCRP